jgi:hypothetical protein
VELHCCLLEVEMLTRVVIFLVAKAARWEVDVVGQVV